LTQRRDFTNLSPDQLWCEKRWSLKAQE